MSADYKAMFKVLRANRRKYLRIKGVHYVDIGYRYKDGIRTDKLCLRLHVHKKLPRKLLGSHYVPKRMDGLQTDIIVANPRLQSRAGTHFSVITGGIDIENPFEGSRGTLGAVLKDADNEAVGLTNYHVLFGTKGRTDDEIIQPSEAMVDPKDVIGAIVTGNSDYDCAYFKLNDARTYDRGIMGVPAQMTGSRLPAHGMAVLKSGVTTEVTYGIIDGICTNYSFTIVANPNKPNPGGGLSGEGDSGSIWLFDDGSGATGIGLHYQGENDGSRAYAFTLDQVMKTLSLQF